MRYRREREARVNESGHPVRCYPNAPASHLFLLEALHGEIVRIHRHLAKEAERERDEYAVQLQQALTNPRVSGTLRGNAKQLPGSSAEGSSEEGHAHPEPGNRADESIGGHPPVPGTGGPASPNSHP